MFCVDVGRSDIGRRNQPWSVAEDKELLRLLRSFKKKHPRTKVNSYGPISFGYFAGKKLGRTTGGVLARLNLLRWVKAHERNKYRAKKRI